MPGGEGRFERVGLSRAVASQPGTQLPLLGGDAQLRGGGCDPSLLRPAEHSSPVACGDGNTGVDGYSKEQAFYPPPMTRESTQPGTLSSQEPSQTHREHSLPPLTSGTADGSRADCRGSLYPSNHDRMPTSLKKKPLAPPDGKGRRSRPSRVAPAVGWGRGRGQPGALTRPLLSHRGLSVDFGKVV